MHTSTFITEIWSQVNGIGDGPLGDAHQGRALMTHGKDTALAAGRVRTQ